MIGRRTLLGLGPATFLSCTRSDGAYFGSTAAPKTRTLIHTLGGEIESLDPAKSIVSWEFYVIPALFEGLVHHHPELPQPMAALATHYEVSPDQTRFTFYLRGHRAPRGNRLANTDTLIREYSRGINAPPDTVPARWSDGGPITADDFVYSWRRFVDAQTAAPMAYQFYCIVNAEEINTGRCEARKLGVRAIDDFTFQVELRAPTPFFLNLITQYLFAAVPRRSIEAARARGEESSWTAPGNIVTSGAFTLREYRKYERLVLIRNLKYYEAGLVGIDQLAFYPVVDGTTALHLYETGVAAAMPSAGFPPVFAPFLRSKKDFHSGRALGGIASSISATRPPFDNVLIRYALNTATDKSAFTNFFHGATPARTVVPPLPGYPSPQGLTTFFDGHDWDVLTFDVEVARALLAKAGYPAGIGSDGRRLEVTYHFPILPETRPKAEIHREQWQRNLGIKIKLVGREFNVHFKMVFDAGYTGIAEYSFVPTYLDPNPFLEPFATQTVNPSAWSAPAFRSQFLEANSTIEPLHRMNKLAECEKLLLQAMPIIPVYFPGFAFLRKPFVRGLGSNLFDFRPFKYAWIDTNWRPQ